MDRDRSRARRSRRLGRRGERAAARYLRRRGLRVLERNVRLGRDEIDIVAAQGETLVFVEVKSRGPGAWSDGLDRLDRAKRRALRRARDRYLSLLGGRASAWRIDLVCVRFAAGRWFPPVEELLWYPGVLDE